MKFLNRNQWRRKPTSRSFFQGSSCFSFFFFSLFLTFLFFYFSYKEESPLRSSRFSIPQFPQCKLTDQERKPLTLNFLRKGEKYLWFAPHSGFSNQLSELKNALLMAGILNRTLIVPPILDHHAVALGSCPKFRVQNPSELRMTVWDHIVQLVRDQRYASMADIVDLSSIKSSSLVRTIDFRVFVSLWCGINMKPTCFGSQCCSMPGIGSLWGNFKHCGSLLSGFEANLDQCVYGVQEDCRTTVWTYQQNNDGQLDAFQADDQLRVRKKISSIRKRRDVFMALGPGTKAGSATVLSFGSLFSAPYKGSELYIDIQQAPKDSRVQSLLKKIEFLPFVPEIINAGMEFAQNRIKVPFLCAQLRLLDGQFKNHWNATFLALEEKINFLRKGTDNAISIFIMTDLPLDNWTGTYLGDLASDSKSYKLHNLLEGDKLVIRTAEKLISAEPGFRSGFFPTARNGTRKETVCSSAASLDILLYVEEAVCSCASLGFVGTSGSTIAESIEQMRKNRVCMLQFENL